jgi:hypothetical protein
VRPRWAAIERIHGLRRPSWLAPRNAISTQNQTGRRDDKVRAPPIRDVIDARSFEALLEGARQDLAGLRSNGGEVRFAISAHIVTARKA